EGDVERREGGRDRARLPEEARGGVQPREPEGVTGGVLALDGERPRDRQQRRQQHRDPEETGRHPREHATARIEREREEQHDDEPEGQHLVQGHARPGLDAQILPRDERRLAPEVHAPTPPRAGVLASLVRSMSAAATRTSSSSSSPSPSSFPATTPSRATPPASTTSRPARARVRSSSCEAMITVRSSSAAEATTVSSTARPVASRPACGSSRSSRLGSRESMTASAS